VLSQYGATLYATGNHAEAIAVHRQALAEVERAGSRYDLAKTLDGLATVLHDEDPAAAGAHWKRALELYDDMGVPERDVILERLAELDER
jgi:hypothetical protein